MALYHLSVGYVSRSTGRSSVQSAAYITGEQLHESRRDLNVNYKNRHSDIAFSDTLAPEHALEVFKNTNVWDILENFEDEYAVKRFPYNLEAREKYQDSAQTAQTIVMALPRELEVDVAKELVEEFAYERFVSRNLIVTYAIHDDEGNPHAHLQISRRAVNLDGSLAWAKDREICSKKELLVTRKLWADLANKYLERAGYDERITEKSFADLGIELEPTKHRGWIADKLIDIGITSRIVNENLETFERNREALITTPGLILDELTSKYATFTQIDLLKAIQKRVGDDALLVASAFERALSDSVVVGEGIDGSIRYTSEAYLQIEQHAVTQIEALMHSSVSSPNSKSIDTQQKQEFLKTNYDYLNQEQQQAVLGLTDDSFKASVLVGRAGAGKTTALKAVADIYKDAGYKVIGTSLSAMAADNLEQETGIESKTLHSLSYVWGKYQSACDKFLSFDAIVDEGLLKQLDWYKDLKKYEKFALTDKHVVVVDEAGMIGTRQWQELLTHVGNVGAKLIAVGDDHQFKAIEAGDFFREIKAKANEYNRLFSLNTIRRQKADWMIKASTNLAELNISEGLSAYEQNGHIHQTSKEYLAKDIAEAYVNKLLGSVEPIGNPKDHFNKGFVLAFTNAQTKEINAEIRTLLKSQGIIAKQDQINIEGKSFALGDKVVFLANDKTRLQIYDKDGVIQEKQFIKNGTQGQIESINAQGDIKITLKDGLFTHIKRETESVIPKVALGQPKQKSTTQTHYNYTKIDHGYAITTHKAQGQTVDYTIVAASKNMDAKGIYVAMTRHRNDVQMFYVREDFKTFRALTSHLSRFEHKDLVKDYTIRPENEQSWQRVQEYKLAVLDAASIIKEGNISSTVDWDAYQKIKTDQIRLGKEILSDFKSHQLYVNQSGLTGEMLEISTGKKARPLSLAEEKAKLTVELYGETAQVARDLWREIKNTHPGANCYNHSKYAEFSQLRTERNSLAHTILENYSLHREFVAEFSKTYGINKRTVEAQSKQFAIKQMQIPNPSLETHNIDEKESKLWYNTKLYNLSYGKYSQVENTYNASKTASYGDHLYNSKNNQPNKIDYALIKQELNSKIKDLAYEFLGHPQQQKPTEWRYGNKGSISIQVAGHKQGLYSNFETGESGNALKFIQDQLNCDHKQAFKWGMDWLGYNQEHQFMQQPAAQLSSQVVNQSQKDFTKDSFAQSKSEWIPLFPAPNQEPNLRQEKQLAYMLKGRQETARFVYKDADSNVLGYVVRLEDKEGNKITPTLTYCRNKEGKEQWRWQGFGNDRPLYGLEQLKDKPNASVLIVEGEKTTEAARNHPLFKDMAVVTWNGGCGAVQKSDWSVLKDRNVIVWPDNDKSGLNAAHKISEILKTQGNQSVKIVDLPSTLPHKWDLADKIPNGVNLEEIWNTSLSKAQVPLASGINNNTIESTAQKYGISWLIKNSVEPYQNYAEFLYQQVENRHEIYGLKITGDNKQMIKERCAVQSLFHNLVKESLEENTPFANCFNKCQEIAGTIAHQVINSGKLVPQDKAFSMIDKAHNLYEQDKIEKAQTVRDLHVKHPHLRTDVISLYVSESLQVIRDCQISYQSQQQEKLTSLFKVTYPHLSNTELKTRVYEHVKNSDEYRGSLNQEQLKNLLNNCKNITLEIESNLRLKNIKETLAKQSVTSLYKDQLSPKKALDQSLNVLTKLELHQHQFQVLNKEQKIVEQSRELER